MASIFNIESKIYKKAAHLSDYFWLHILFFFSAIFIFTFGTAYAALIHCLRNLEYSKGEGIISDYIKAFKENFKQSFIINFFIIILALISYIDYKIVQFMSYSFLSLPFIFTLIVIYFLYPYIFSLQSLYILNKKQILQTAFFIAFKYLPYTIAIALIYGLPILHFIINPLTFYYTFILWFLFLFPLQHRIVFKILITVYKKVFYTVF